MARHVDGAIAELAPKTLGLLTYCQLDALGVSRQQRRRLVATGVLVPVGALVVRHAAFPTSWEQRMLAAVLVARDGALASHMAAAWLWRFDGIRPGPVEVTIPRDRNARSVPGTVHRSARIEPADMDLRQLIPKTSATRTFLDIAPRLGARQLEEVLDGAERDGKIWRRRLRWDIDRLRHAGRAGRPGMAAVQALLDRTEGRPLGDSWLEQEAIRLVSATGLRMPRVQVKRRTHGGAIARVDLWWDRETLVVELAGHGTHATRRQRQADDERAARLGLCGWAVVEFTYEDVVERPDYVAAMIADHLAIRSGTTAARADCGAFSAGAAGAVLAGVQPHASQRLGATPNGAGGT
jgi:very-short-patch-repair endonuclease